MLLGLAVAHAIKMFSKVMTKAEPIAADFAAINRLVGNAVPIDTVNTIDVEHALAVLRSENARLKEKVAATVKTAAQSEETHKRDIACRRKENLKLQSELLTAQQRVYELQEKLLSLRAIVNSA